MLSHLTHEPRPIPAIYKYFVFSLYGTMSYRETKKCFFCLFKPKKSVQKSHVTGSLYHAGAMPLVFCLKKTSGLSPVSYMDLVTSWWTDLITFLRLFWLILKIILFDYTAFRKRLNNSRWDISVIIFWSPDFSRSTYVSQSVSLLVG